MQMNEIDHFQGLRGTLSRNAALARHTTWRVGGPADFFATIYKILGIDPNKEHQASGGRPIRIAGEGAKPIDELLG